MVFIILYANEVYCIQTGCDKRFPGVDFHISQFKTAVLSGWHSPIADEEALLGYPSLASAVLTKSLMQVLALRTTQLFLSMFLHSQNHHLLFSLVAFDPFPHLCGHSFHESSSSDVISSTMQWKVIRRSETRRIRVRRGSRERVALPDEFELSPHEKGSHVLQGQAGRVRRREKVAGKF